MALKRDWIPSPNYSSRGGSGVRLVIVHTAEGSRSYSDLGAYFGSSSAGVSSHVGIDDTPGRIGEYVKRPNKAWTSGNANPYSVNVELCGFASWSPAEWERHPAMLDNLARWIAEECKHYGIPIVKLSAAQASSGRGVCGHVDVSGPGGHWDPGPNLPWSKVIAAAKNGGPVYGAAPAPDVPLLAAPIAHTATLEGSTMPDFCLHDTSTGNDGSSNYYAVFASGIVRRCNSQERAAWGVGKPDGPPMIQADLSSENSNLLRDYDSAMRGLVKERK